MSILSADSNDIESVPLSNLELDFDLNMTDEPSVSPSLFDGSTSVSRSSATSITSLGVKRA